MSTELERTKVALEVAVNAIKSEAMNAMGCGRKVALAAILDRIDILLNPPPETEEVTVERFMCSDCESVYPTAEVDKGCCLGKRLVKLTGTFQRPKVQKAERSCEVEAKIKAGSGGDKGQTISLNGYYSVFQDHPECHGRTGTLTFTWTE